MCRAGALLTQAPLSPSGFAFATQLPEGAEQAAEAVEAAAAGSSPAQQQQPGQPLPLNAQQAAADEDGGGETSLQGSVGRSQGSAGSGGDGGVDSRSRRLSGSSWLLTPLGALAQVFKRNATQVGGFGRQVDEALYMSLFARVCFIIHVLCYCSNLPTSWLPSFTHWLCDSLCWLPQAQQAPSAGAFLAPQGPSQEVSAFQPSQGLNQQQLLVQQQRQAAALRHAAATAAAGGSGRAGLPGAAGKAAAGTAAPAGRPSSSAWNARPAALTAAAAAVAPAAKPPATSIAATEAAAEVCPAEQALASAAEEAAAETAAGEEAAEGGGTPKAKQQGQQQGRRLSGGFLDILARISSPEPPSRPASPGPQAAAAAKPEGAPPAASPVSPAAGAATTAEDQPAPAAGAAAAAVAQPAGAKGVQGDVEMADAEVAVAEDEEAQQADLPASEPAEEMAAAEEQEEHIHEQGEQPMPCLSLHELQSMLHASSCRDEA